MKGCEQGYPADYHEYVFKDGRLVGDFDNMYRYAKGTPWDQGRRCNEWSAQVGMLMLQSRAPFETILEIGCGLGYISAKLKTLAKGTIDAFDVSPEAIRKAKNLHGGIGFYVDNIIEPFFQPRRQYDLVVIREVFWYCCHTMEMLVRKINERVKPQGYLYVCQSFPALNGQFVGKEVIPTPEKLMDYFCNYDLVYSARCRNHHLLEDGPILHFLGIKAK